MISTVKLYKDSLIIDGRNFVVDDIADYLATLSDTITLSQFQYIKHGLSISIKINKSQTYLNYIGVNDYNYCSITNSKEDGTEAQKTVYYFIDKMNWIAESTIKLDLIMDTINTFRLTTDFTISDRTTILREHKDRYRKILGETVTKNFQTSTYCDTQFAGDYVSLVIINTGGTSVTVNSITHNGISVTYTIVGGKINLTVTNWSPNERVDITVNATVVMPITYQRIIDPVSEGIQSLLFKKSSEDILDNNNLNWYLIYKNKTPIDPSDFNPTNPIAIQLRASETISVKYYDDFHIVPGDLNNDEYMLFTSMFVGLPVVSFENLNNAIYALQAIGYYNSIPQFNNYIKEYADNEDKVAKAVVVYKTANKLYIGRVDFVDTGSGYMDASDIKGAVEVDNVYIESNGYLSGDIDYYTGSFANTDDLKAYHGTSNTSDTLGLIGPITIPGIDLLDRTDSELIKVIECPYCPSDLKLDNQYYILGRGWKTVVDGDYTAIELGDINTDFINNIESDIDNPIKELYRKSLTISTTASRDDTNESKLFHSDYYQNKIVYDSFSYMIALENLDVNNPILSKTVPDLFKIDWITANTISSKFLAIFPQLEYSRSIQDFDNLLYINRNNELPIFNSTYLNYLRNGYNYDVKQKDAAIEKANDDLFLSIINSGTRIGGGALTGFVMGNVPGAIMGAATGAASAVISTVQQYKNAAYNIARQEDSIAQKLVQAKATAIAVSAADDVNLLMQYCPVAKSINYSVGDNFKKAIADLFYYCGYRREVQGSPNFTNRYWFNFVAAELVIATTNNIPSDIMNDIVYRYKEGITQLHHHTTWNFSQDKENWEVSLL